MGPSTGGDGALEPRIVEAALDCIGRWGVGKTTLDDVARRAGCGRATIYRTFSGGKAAVVDAVIASERARLEAEVDAALEGATSLEELLTSGTVAVARFVYGHRALGYLFAHEPDLVLPHVAFDRLEPLLAAAGAHLAPRLDPFVEGDPGEAAEWVARVVLTHLVHPPRGLNLGDPAGARRLVTTYLVPALRPAASPLRS